jgi:hypothetical protein
MPNDVYDITQYEDSELYEMLDMSPTSSDREIEAKIIHLVRQYMQYDSEEGRKIVDFYQKIYKRLFAVEEEDAVEGFMVAPIARDSSSTGARFTETGKNPSDTNVVELGQTNRIMSNTISTTTDYRKGDTLLTKPLDYSKDQLNPLLKQTIRRIINIDSQYRENKDITLPTDFTFNLSEPLRDVVSLQLYSVTIPFTWYTISRAYGANFFYLKGSAPGLETEAHDYKISVTPGTYDAPDLTTALNQGIARMITNHPDVDFGTTGLNNTLSKVVYTKATGKTNLEINIRKLFHESSYRIEFPAGSYSSDTSTLAGYLGFGQGQLGSIAGGNATSNYIPVASILSVMQFTSDSTPLVPPSSNIQLKIRPYVSPLPYVSLPSSQYFMEDVVTNGVVTGTKILEATIVLPVTESISYTRAQLITMLDTALRTDTSNKLDTAYCGAEWVDGRVQMRVKWNPRAFPAANISDQYKKCVVIFPYVNTSSEITRFWCIDETVVVKTDTSSVFGFSMNRGTVNSFPVLDTHVHIGTNSVPKSRFDLASTNTISLKCNLAGYVNALNHYDFPINKLDNGYKLPALLAAINTSIRTNAKSAEIFTIGNNTPNQTSIYQNPDDTIEWKTWIHKSFANADYTFQAKGVLTSILGLRFDHTAESVRNINSEYVFESVTFNSNATIVFAPININNRGNSPVFTVTFGDDNIPITEEHIFIARVQSSFKNFTASGRFPFSGTTFVKTDTNKYSLTLVLSFDLTYKDFTLDFTAASDIRSQLFFSNTYKLSQNPLLPNDKVTSTSACPANLLTVAVNSSTSISNGVMRLVPIPSIAGLQTTVDNRYIIQVTVPPGTYNHTEVIDILNLQLQSSSATNVLSSTYCTLSAYDAATYNPLTGLSTKLSYVRFSVDIMQRFTTKDFRVVFYDPFSFITCVSANKIKGTNNRTIQNVTFDTTIGYILGFRQSIIYNLEDYLGLVDDDGAELNYYGTSTGTIDTSNVCYMIGDTVTKTDLYTYFMIMLDDYVQNHINDGVVSLAKQEVTIIPEPYIMICNPATGILVPRPLDYESPGVNYTAKELIAFQQKVASVQIQESALTRRPFVKDSFAFIPLRNKYIAGESYTEFGGNLNQQERSYFGPVNIHRMTIRLVNDRGELVDTNGVDWNISLICEQLYKNI